MLIDQRTEDQVLSQNMMYIHCKVQGIQEKEVATETEI